MSQQGSDQSNSENSAERPPLRPVSLRPSESSGSLSGSLPPPLKLQPLGRPGPPPPAPPPSSGLTPIQLQQLELKGGGARPGGAPGVNIPPRPVSRPTDKPPADPSGNIPPGWPPPRVDLGEEHHGPIGKAPVHEVEPLPRFLPGPETSSRSRGADPIKPAPPPVRVALGPPPDLDEPVRGGMELDSKATWAEDERPATSSGLVPRPKKDRGARLGKGPVLLVTAFAAVLLAVLVWPPKSKGPVPVASASSPVLVSPTPDSASSTPSALASASPEASATASPEASATPLVSATPKPMVTPKPVAVVTPKPVAVVTPKPVVTPTPVAVVTPKPLATPSPVAVVTPKPVATATPKPVVTPKPVAVVTPKPVVTPSPVALASPKLAATPKPVVEDPPAKSTESYCSVRVFVTPSDLDAKVYLVNSAQRYSEHGAGNVRLQPDKKGTYTLKVIAPGYETFTKEIKVTGDHKLAVRLEKIPPPPQYVPEPGPAPAPYSNPAPYSPPPAPYYPPPAPAPYQIPAPNI